MANTPNAESLSESAISRENQIQEKKKGHGRRPASDYRNMELASRKVIHMQVTHHPTIEWTEQQVLNACFMKQPKFLLHTNDGKFGQLGRSLQVENEERKISCRSAFDAWLWETMNIRGISIPYGAPNAAACMERLIGTLRRECLDRLLIWNERHLRLVLLGFSRIVEATNPGNELFV